MISNFVSNATEIPLIKIYFTLTFLLLHTCIDDIDIIYFCYIYTFKLISTCKPYVYHPALDCRDIQH